MFYCQIIVLMVIVKDDIGMGWLDKDDIMLWIDWIIQQDENAKIVIHGVSMGGATTMMLSGENPDHVVGYIEDCGYSSVWNIFKSELSKRFSLPTFPILDISNLVVKFKAGYDLKEASSVEQIKKVINRCYLFMARKMILYQ